MEKFFNIGGIGGSNTPEFRTLKTKPTVVDSLDDFNINGTWGEGKDDKEFFLELEQQFLNDFKPSNDTGGLLKDGIKGNV